MIDYNLLLMADTAFDVEGDRIRRKLREQYLQQKQEEQRQRQVQPHVIEPRTVPRTAGIRVEGVACASKCVQDIAEHMENTIDRIQPEIDKIANKLRLEGRRMMLEAKLEMIDAIKAEKLKESKKPDGGVVMGVKYDWCPTEKRWKPGCSEERCASCYKGVIIQPPLIFRQV